MNNIPTINEIDNNSPSQDSKDVVVSATVNQPQVSEVEEKDSARATIEEIDATRKPTISEIYQIVNDGLFEATTNWWDYSYKLSQAQINQDIISRLDNGEVGGGYNKPGVEIITTTSDKTPTNANVYSALKSDSLYPKKLVDENISGVYDFLNGITIGKFSSATGARIYPDTYGRSHLDVDYLNVRLKAIFETLQILNVETIGGKMVISPAGSIRIAYVNTITETIDDVEQEVYRCYFLGEQDGNEVDNKWKVGDQAQAKSFNVKKGTYHRTGNHYFWRLVVGVSEEPVEINGNKYHYVDLSSIVADTASDIPQPGDILNQLGYRGDDAQRQSALVFSAVDGYAPSITLYSGVNDFTLLNKEYVEYGVYQGKAFFNVYGDMYIGDKGINPTTYIKFKSGKLDIKANLELGSSIDGKDFEQYIKDHTEVDENTIVSIVNNSQVISDLQKQIDGAIETWFYNGVPTNDNIPAKDWKTSEIDIRESHVGDIYYDKDTQYAYRYTKYDDDNNPYDWSLIRDTGITDALTAANNAQATADSKMKIFYGDTEPTDYQAGDMWVNAKLAGQFDNDIARSTTDSKEFDATHWVLASRYSESIQSLLTWSSEYTTKFDDLTEVVKNQKDQSITNWFYDYEPTLDNEPAKLWDSNELKKEHIGDIFYDTKNNHSYRWTGSEWIIIKDADFDAAMEKAKEAAEAAGAANDLADKKRQIFYADKTPDGADNGDLWIKQVKDNKTEVWVFDGTNWIKSDDKDLADYSTAINTQLEGIAGQIDGKAETWYQATDPKDSWEDKTKHKGDIWYNTTDGTTQYWNGTAWEMMDIPNDVFDTIDGKSSIFVDSYDDAKAGKGAIANGYKERDIWILPADATVNGTEYYKGDILTATVDGTSFNEQHWTKKVRYVGDKELEDKISEVDTKITNLTADTLPNLDEKFNKFAEDGIIDSSEKARLADLLTQANNEVLAITDQITNITASDYLDSTNANVGKLTEAQKTLTIAWNDYNKLVTGIVDGTTTIDKDSMASTKNSYHNLQNAIKEVKQYLSACQADVLSSIGTDISSYKYLKEAFKGKTEVNGGLVVTNVLQLRQTSDTSSPITAGISGLQGKANAKGEVDTSTFDITSIAAWFGGPMVDKDIFTKEELANKKEGDDYARSLFRHDGSGYLAGGKIYWDNKGVLTVSPDSLIANLSGNEYNLIYFAYLFRLVWNVDNPTSISQLSYIEPQYSFSHLNVLNTISVPKGSIEIGDIVLSYDEDNKALKITHKTNGTKANVYASGGISAYGVATTTSGGGGLNGKVLPYNTAINLTSSTDETTNIASAWSIKKLYDRIESVASAIPSINVSVADGGNALTGATYSNGTIRFTKSTFLTSSDLNGYATESWVEGKGYLTSHQSLANYLTKADASDTYLTKTAAATDYQVKGSYAAASHTHNYLSTLKVGTTSYNVDSNTITIPAYPESLPANDVYDWAKKSTKPSYSWEEINERPSKVSDFSNDTGFITANDSIDGNAATASKLQTARNINGTLFNGTADITTARWGTSRSLWGNSVNGGSDINGSITIANNDGVYVQIGGVRLVYDKANAAIKVVQSDGKTSANFYATGGITAYGDSSVSGGGSGFNGSVLNLTSIRNKTFSDTDYTTVPNAAALKTVDSNVSSLSKSLDSLSTKVTNLEGGSATTVKVEGTGNAVTAVNKSGTTITFTKGSTFSVSGHTHSWTSITDKPSSLKNPYAFTVFNINYDGSSAKSVTKESFIYTLSEGTSDVTDGTMFVTSYASNNGFSETAAPNTPYKRKASALWNYIKDKTDSLYSTTTHTHTFNSITNKPTTLSGYGISDGVTTSDSRLTDSRYPKFANNTWYLVGDDVYIGDHNIAATLCLKTNTSNNNTTGIALYNYAATDYAKLWFDNANLNVNKQLVVANNRIWVQGSGKAGGNNNRLTLVSGMPSGLAYNTSCRGTILYSNGIAFADPYNGNSNNDSAWIRHLETTANIGLLEIGVGNNNSDEEIHFRWYDTTSTSEHIGNDITVPRATGTLALTSDIPTSLPANGGNADTVDNYHASSLGKLNEKNEGHLNFGSWSDAWSDGTNKHPWYGYDHTNPNTGIYSTTISDYFGMTIKTANTLNLDCSTLTTTGLIHTVRGAKINKVWIGLYTDSTARYSTVDGDTSDGLYLQYYSAKFLSLCNGGGNVGIGTNSPSYRLHVNGTAHANLFHVSDGNHTGIQLGSTYLSCLSGNVIFQNNTAIRFGGDSWDWNVWAGLKYVHSSKTIYLGLADGSAFSANSAQTGGELRLPNINTVTSFGSFFVYKGQGAGPGGTYEYGTTYSYSSITCSFGVMAPSNVISLYDSSNGISISAYGALTLSASTGNAIYLNSTNNVVIKCSNTSTALDINGGIFASGNITASGNILAKGGVSAYQSSDIRLKTNLHTLDYVQTIKSLGSVYEFNYKKDNKSSIGLIAQNVQNSILADLVETDEEGYLKLNYWSPKLISLALGGITQVDDEVTRLKARVRELENEVKQLKNKDYELQ